MARFLDTGYQYLGFSYLDKLCPAHLHTTDSCSEAGGSQMIYSVALAVAGQLQMLMGYSFRFLNAKCRHNIASIINLKKCLFWRKMLFLCYLYAPDDKSPALSF